MSLLSINLDLLRCIDRYLSPYDLIKLSHTCTKLYRIFAKEKFWYQRLIRDYPEEVLCPAGENCYRDRYCKLYYMPEAVRDVCRKGQEKYEILLKLITDLKSCSRQELIPFEEDEEDGDGNILTRSFFIVFTSRAWPIPVVKSMILDDRVFPHQGSAGIEMIYHIDREHNVAYYRILTNQHVYAYMTLPQLCIWLQSLQITHRPLTSPITINQVVQDYPQYFTMR